MKKRQSDLHFVFQKSRFFFLLYSVFFLQLPEDFFSAVPYQSSVPENQCTAQIQYSVA